MITLEFIEVCKKKLLALKIHLEEEIAGLSGHTELSEDDGDIDASVHEFEMDELAANTLASFKERLQKVIRALQKIDDGTYGTTDDGREIPIPRLEVEPEANSLVEDPPTTQG